MEVAQLPKSVLRIKGKTATIFINPPGNHDGSAAVYLRDASQESHFSEKDGVVVASAGEYEVGGLKIKGVMTDGQLTFSLLVDNVEVLLGTLSAFEKVYSKLQEHDVVVVDVDGSVDPSFLTSLASHALLFAGDQAATVVKTFIKDSIKTQPKFAATKEKLPQEVETILLA